MAPRPTLPTFDLRSFTLPTLPAITLPTLPAVDEKIVAAVRDAAYVGVGLAVLAVQQVETRSRDLVEAISDRVRRSSR